MSKVKVLSVLDNEIDKTECIIDSYSKEILPNLHLFKTITELKINELIDCEITVFPPNITHLTLYGVVVINAIQLPQTIIDLNISFSNVIIHELPANLQTLKYNFCNLTTLPKLPDSLRELNCSRNNIYQLPVLPTLLSHLDCSYNFIYMLPKLPKLLLYLNCVNNSVDKLPDLPMSLVYLYIPSCVMHILPEIPDTLLEFKVGDVSIFTTNNVMHELLLPGCKNIYKNAGNRFDYETHRHKIINKINYANRQMEAKYKLSQIWDEYMTARMKLLMKPTRISRLLDSGYLALDSLDGWYDL